MNSLKSLNKIIIQNRHLNITRFLNIILRNYTYKRNERFLYPFYKNLSNSHNIHIYRCKLIETFIILIRK